MYQIKNSWASVWSLSWTKQTDFIETTQDLSSDHTGGDSDAEGITGIVTVDSQKEQYFPTGAAH